MNELSGWGRYPKIKTKELIPQSESELLEILRHSESYIPRGNGRSYGDSAINKNLTVTMTRMNRLLQWNQESGELVAESGVLIVPGFGNPKTDIMAKSRIESYFPDRDVYLIEMLSSWSAGGGVHCHTNDQPAFSVSN